MTSHLVRTYRPLLALAGIGTLCSHVALANSYSFTQIIQTGDPVPVAPAGNTANYVAVYGLNDLDDLIIVAAGAQAPAEAEYVYHAGQFSELAYTGGTGPGGLVFSNLGDFGAVQPINNRGDALFTFFISPDTLPYGTSTGVFQRSVFGNITPLMLPGVTKTVEGVQLLGTGQSPSQNNLGDVVFTGMTKTNLGISGDLGQGLHLARDGKVFTIIAPGDTAPGGGKFDFVSNPRINDFGVMAFGAHIAGEECVNTGADPAVLLFCGESTYLRQPDGQIKSIAHQGQAAPGGGNFRIAWGPVINDRGDIAFVGDLTPPPNVFQTSGIFYYSRGETYAVARPGTAMPGGGHFANFSPAYADNYSINNLGSVAFLAALDTGSDTGAYVWSAKDGIQLIARTGTMVGSRKIVTVSPYSYIGNGPMINDRGDVALAVQFDDGNVAVLLGRLQ